MQVHSVIDRIKPVNYALSDFRLPRALQTPVSADEPVTLRESRPGPMFNLCSEDGMVRQPHADYAKSCYEAAAADGIQKATGRPRNFGRLPSHGRWLTPAPVLQLAAAASVPTAGAVIASSTIVHVAENRNRLLVH
jgi:hypothetical protein